MDSADRYATAKANLRDTVKWLATCYAGLAALILAGAPFSNAGSLPLTSPRLWVAAFSIVAALVLLYKAWTRALELFRAESFDAGMLRSDYDPNKITDEALRADIKEITEEFAEKSDRFLKKDYPTYEKLEEKVDQAWTQITNSQTDSGREAWTTQWKGLSGHAQQLVNWASYRLMDRRITNALPALHRLNAAALLFLVMFAWAANPAKSKDEGGTVVIEQLIEGGKSGGAEGKVLRSVLFAHGKSELSDGDLVAIRDAREFLLKNPGYGILLLAHTDTTGNARVNRDLAHKRASVVRGSLVAEGGIAPSRVFVSELPESALPVVTTQETNNEDNRTVKLVAVPLPAR